MNVEHEDLGWNTSRGNDVINLHLSSMPDVTSKQKSKANISNRSTIDSYM